MMNRLNSLVNNNFSTENNKEIKELNYQEYIEIIDLLTKYCNRYKFSSFIILLKLIIHGTNFINDQKFLHVKDKFWNVLDKLTVDPLKINNEIFERKKIIINYTMMLLEKSLIFDTYHMNWKLLLLLINYSLNLQNLKDILLNNLINYLQKKELTLITLLINMKNLQQLIFFIKFLTSINLNSNNLFNNSLIVNKKNTQDLKLFKFLTSGNTNRTNVTVIHILKYIKDNNMIPETNQIFQPSKILYNLSEKDKFINFNNIKNSNQSIIYCIKDYFYLWNDTGICLEFNKNNNLKIFKNLKDEIVIDLSNSNFVTINNGTQSQQIQHIKYFYIIFENDKLRNQLLSLICDKPQKISKSIGIISLNYLDFEEEIEQPQESQDVITSLPDVINTMANQNNKEQVSKSLTQSIITPDDSTDHSEKLDEWKINGTSDNNEAKDNNIGNLIKETAHEQINTLHNPNELIEISDSSLSIKNQPLHPVDEICKKGKIVTNVKNQNDRNLITQVNKKLKVINNNNDKNISILNKIFQVDSKKTNKTHRNKILKKKKTQLSGKKTDKQKKLSNVKQIITIPSQDIPEKITSNQQKETQNDQKTFTDGPAQRTRHFQKKRSSSIEYKAPVKATEATSKQISNKQGKSMHDETLIQENHDVTDELPTNDISHKDTQVDNDEIHQESTIISNTTLIPKQTLPINTSSILDPQNFTNVLQAQINNSVAIFSNELTKKLAVINDEMNNTILKDLSIKYQSLIDELKMKFNNDTTKILHFVTDFQHLLSLPEDQLRTAIRDQFEASKGK
ncbi:RNA elimination defective protein Red1 [Maudiozyma exigua]|uniref:RNA elimination defective protein Red1 n=1 Tax=Maudiozyma exigua TaxID=34358 RepID=A0A9P7B924_MAUEX|nr:RNA elimination defective protein Red1 [Kazachstania exigua]